ncbi:MAG: TRAP transporter small permease [Burkholderiaceae bacterium]
MRRFLQVLCRIEAFIASLAYVIVAGLLFGDVISRELLGQGFSGTPQFATLLTVVAGFMGFALVSHDGTHLRIEAVDHLLPAWTANAHERLGDAVSAAICLFFAVVAARFVLGTWQADEVVAVLYIPLWPWQAVLAYGFGSSALRHLVFAWRPDLKPVRENRVAANA